MNLNYDKPAHPEPNLDFQSFAKSEACQRIVEIKQYWLPEYLREINEMDRAREVIE